MEPQGLLMIVVCHFSHFSKNWKNNVCQLFGTNFDTSTSDHLSIIDVLYLRRGQLGWSTWSLQFSSSRFEEVTRSWCWKWCSGMVDNCVLLSLLYWRIQRRNHTDFRDIDMKWYEDAPRNCLPATKDLTLHHWGWAMNFWMCSCWTCCLYISHDGWKL